MSKDGKYKSRQPMDLDDLDEIDNIASTDTGAGVSESGVSAETQSSASQLSLEDLSARCEELETKHIEAEKKRDENWEQVLRLQAEIHNLHKRHERDITHAHRFGIEKFIKELIPVVDSLEQSLMASTQEQESIKAIREGVEMTLNLFYKALEKFGVTLLDPIGEPFNPQYHEAMTAQEHAEVAPNTILMVLQKGYVLHERLLRPARVIVSKAK